MLIICKMRNDCLCWLFLFGVDIIRDYLPQVIELPFCAGIILGRCIVYSTIWIKNHLESFSLFPALTPIQNESDAWKHWWHVTCTYFDMAGYDVTNYVTWIAKWHHWTFSLNSLRVLSFDTKMSNFKPRWEIMAATQYYGNLLFISIIVYPRKTVHLKTFLWIFSQFYEKYCYIWCIKWCKC